MYLTVCGVRIQTSYATLRGNQELEWANCPHNAEKLVASRIPEKVEPSAKSTGEPDPRPNLNLDIRSESELF